MNHLGIAPLEREEKRRELLKKVKPLGTIFIVVCLLPVLVYFLFHFGIFTSKPPYPKDLEMPVAMVSTGEGTGTAFLVGETRLLTAKHVVAEKKVGDIFQLVFEKAEPPITTDARLVWKEPSNLEPPDYYVYDVAVLELTNPTALPENFPRMELGTSEGVGTREHVILVGYPAGLYSITDGIISNDRMSGLEIFQLDAGAWPGSSGGPLILESTGEVIGILVAGMEGEFQGINMACKITNINKLIEASGLNIIE